MHSTDTKSSFLELRAKGWSLARIAERLNVSKRTLVDWNQQCQAELQLLQAVEMEAVQEKILASHEQELVVVASQINRIETELASRDLKHEQTRDLCRMLTEFRAELRRLRLPAAALEMPKPVANPKP